MIDTHIGYLPPPLGGISVYLYRLSKSDKNVKVIDLREITGKKKLRFWILKKIFDFKKCNFIIHSMSIKDQLIFYFLSCLSIHKFSLVIHGKQLFDKYYDSKIFKRIIIRNMLNKANFIQIVNPDYKFYLKSFGVKNKNIIIKHAFLPPILEDELKISKSYSQELFNFLNNKKPLIIASGGALYFYKNIDLYGVDMCIELTGILKKNFPNIGFLFVLGDTDNQTEYLFKLKTKIKELEIEKSFFLMIEQKEIWPLFKKVDLMIRPTFIDAYGISIAEALYFKCPVVASDVCKRPEGTFLFKNRDLKDLFDKTVYVLNKKIIK